MAKDELQLRFHGGQQQRYFSDRRALLECILRISGQSQGSVFEVWAEDSPVILADGRMGGKRYSLREVLDLSEANCLERLTAELQSLRYEHRSIDG